MRKNFMLFISIFYVMFTMNSCDKAVEPQSNDYHNKILFTSSRSGKEQLYMMNPDGTGIQQITSGEYSHSNGRWSPDVTKIVCSTNENTNTSCYSMMKVLNADGSNSKLLHCGSQMAWFPTSENIFFTYCSSCEVGIFNAALYSIDPKGGDLKLVSHDFVGEITFSIDGKTIAYVYADSHDSIPNPVLKYIDYPTFTNTRQVGPNGVTYPAWSPNGREIVFSSQNDGVIINGAQVNNIFIMDSSGVSIRKITNHNTLEHNIEPRWSADGSRIIFIAFAIDGTQRSSLYIVNSDGTNLGKILDDVTVTSADWSR